MHEKLSSYLERYLSSQSTLWSESTYKTLKAKLHTFFRFYEEAKGDPKAVFEAMVAEGFGKYTLKIYFRIFAKFEIEVLESNAFTLFLKQNPQLFRFAYAEKTRSIRRGEFQKILQAAKVHSAEMFNFVYLMGKCGLRLEEASQAKWDHILQLPDSDLVFLKVLGKGSRVREVPITSSELQATGTEKLCGRPRNFRAFLKQFDLTPHDFRAFFVTRAVNIPGIDLKAVMDVVGHSDVRTTQKYWRADQEKAARLISKEMLSL
jgi:integrase